MVDVKDSRLLCGYRGALIMTSQAKAAAMPCRKLPKMPPIDKLKVKKSVAVILKYEKIGP